MSQFEDELSEIANRYKKNKNEFADEVTAMTNKHNYCMFFGLNLNKNDEDGTTSYSGTFFCTKDTGIVEMVFMKEVLEQELRNLMQ